MRVLPFCSACLPKIVADPVAWVDDLRAATNPKPKLVLISDGGVSDGIPRGEIRLVDDE